MNGSIEAQAAVKTALAVFPLCALSGIAIASSSLTRVRAFLLFVLLAHLIFGAKAKSSFEVGMPDTMTATAVLTSALVLFERYRLKISLIDRYSFASICGVVAVLSKKPGIVWGLFSLPILAAFPSLMGARRTRELAFPLIPPIVAIVWWLTEGSGFHLDEGPVKRSM